MTKPKELPSQEMLNSLLSYEPSTGFLFWKRRDVSLFVDGAQSAQWRCDRWNSRFDGKQAFTAKKGDGYYHTNLRDQWMTAHRVIWKMMYGEEPDTIDHVDGNRGDNQLHNLRSVSVGDNIRNSARRSRYTNPYNGVRRTKQGKWQSYLNSGGQFVSFGCFDTPEEARDARKAAEVDFGLLPRS